MRLLIIGSLDGHITTAGKIAMDRGAKVAHVQSIPSGLAQLRSGQGADLVMIDVKLDIASLVLSLKNERIHVPVVACGIGTSADAAVAAIKAGAKEYVPLPPNAELIAAVIAAVTEESTQVVYRDPSMSSTIKLAEQIAPSDASVLITGESGTGKEVMARFLHAKSRRSNEKFVSINCAAIPENLLESELFGHHRRRHTAHRQVRGSQWRHLAAGRDQRDGHPPAGEAAPRHPGARDRPGRRQHAGEGQHPLDRHLEP